MDIVFTILKYLFFGFFGLLGLLIAIVIIFGSKIVKKWDYDAIILAASGLKRLEFHDRIKSVLTADESLPSVGQGALGIECLSGKDELKALLAPLSHGESECCVKAERTSDSPLPKEAAPPATSASICAISV